MKELSIEEKACRYDEAIKRLEDIETGNCQKTFMFTEGLFDYIFPELRESEDERIRKEIISAIKEDWPGHTDWVAWLEKDGQKPADKVEQKKLKKTKFKTGDRIIGIVSGIQYYITEICDDHYCTESGCIIMFCAQENFELYKQKPSWSEEDEKLCLDLLQYFKDGYGLEHTIESVTDWLKSLRHQSRWKPSDEQIGVIEAVINNRSFQRRHLDSLYEQLKKLREE